MSGKAIRKHELRKAAREHVDHEMARFLDLHVEINRGSHQGIVLGAILTAYASHARNLLEFFKERTPTRPALHPGTAYFSLYLPSGVLNRFAGLYNGPEEHVWSRATQQVAHLSGFRAGADLRRKRWRRLKEWGSRYHRDAILPKIRTALDEVRGAATTFPSTFAAFRRWEAAGKP